MENREETYELPIYLTLIVEEDEQFNHLSNSLEKLTLEKQAFPKEYMMLFGT